MLYWHIKASKNALVDANYILFRADALRNLGGEPLGSIVLAAQQCGAVLPVPADETYGRTNHTTRVGVGCFFDH